MEVSLKGTEVHVLREIVEDVIVRNTRELEKTTMPEAVADLKERILILKSVLEKFPVELTAV